MTKQLTRLIHIAAEQAAPDTLDLWPAIRERLTPRPAQAARRGPGVLTAATATLIVLIAALLFLLVRGSNPDPLHVASLNQITPTVSPPAETDETANADLRDALCGQYPVYCVPFIDGVEPDHLMALVESAANPRAGAMPDNSAGVVRGLTPDGVPFIGNPAAPVRFEIVQDFRCPHCATFHLGVLGQYIQADVLDGEAVVQMRFVASMGGPYSELASHAAYCAGEQGAFWEMTSRLFATEISDPAATRDIGSRIPQIAFSMGLDTEALNACIDSGRYRETLDQNQQIAQDRGVTGVPTVLASYGSSGNWVTLLATRDELVNFTTAANPCSGMALLDRDSAYGLDLSNHGDYQWSDTFTSNNPRGDLYWWGWEKVYEPLATTSDGWALLNVEADDTPRLIMNSCAESGATHQTAGGALLFRWTRDIPGYHVAVDGSITSPPESYTLRLRGMADVLDSTGDEVTLGYREPQVMTFRARAGEIVHLTIEAAVDYPRSDQSAATDPQPEVAVLLPYGEVLTTFRPGQTQKVEIDFIAPPEGEQYLVFNPLDTLAGRSQRGVIALRVEVAQEPITGEPSELGGTIVLPEGTIAVSIPAGGYAIANADSAAWIGQAVDVTARLLVVTSADPAAPGQIIESGDFQMINTTFSVLAQGGVVVSGPGGPYLAPFSSDYPDLLWATGQEEWGAITLAVTPDEATALEWAVDAGIPVVITPASKE